MLPVLSLITFIQEHVFKLSPSMTFVLFFLVTHMPWLKGKPNRIGSLFYDLSSGYRCEEGINPPSSHPSEVQRNAGIIAEHLRQILNQFVED